MWVSSWLLGGVTVEKTWSIIFPSPKYFHCLFLPCITDKRENVESRLLAWPLRSENISTQPSNPAGLVFVWWSCFHFEKQNKWLWIVDLGHTADKCKKKENYASLKKRKKRNNINIWNPNIDKNGTNRTWKPKHSISNVIFIWGMNDIVKM